MEPMHDDTAPETVAGEEPPAPGTPPGGEEPPAPGTPPGGEELPPPAAGPPPAGPPPAQPPSPGANPVAVASEEAALSRAAAELDQVEAALARLEDGSSDVCEVCRGPIGRQRLLENPLLTRCADHPAGNQTVSER